MNPKAISSSQLLDSLRWRYAVKQFDATKKISDETWSALEESLVLSASSFGLQPYRFLIIRDPEIRARLLPHSWGQKQVVEASHYVVFAERTRMTESDIDAFLDLTARTRGQAVESLKGLRGMMTGSILSPAFQTQVPQWAALQVYIALGSLLTSAALLGVDACPMEGFVPAEYDQILDLRAQGYASVVCCALGYRASSDKYATLKKVRRTKSELITTI
jgi:nitroreductase